MPLLDRPILAAAALIYLAAVLGVGVWALRRTRDERDFFLAGQRPGLLAIGLATAAAAFSGFVFLGGPGLTYRLGLSSLMICVSVGFTPALLCWTLARRLRLLASVRPVLTIPDAFLARWDDRRLSGIAALAVLVGTIGYLGVQVQACGLLLDSLFGASASLGRWGEPAAMALGLAIVLAYAVAGGMVAGVYTDVLQGALMVVAAVAVFAQAMRAGGGFKRIVASIHDSAAFGPEFLDPLAGVPLFTALGFFLVFSLGVLGQPHMLHKFYMLRDPRQLRWMPAVLGGAQSLALLIWIGIGLAVPALVAQGRLPNLTDPDQAAPIFLLRFAPDLLTGVTMAAVLAAIMSTADSFINIGAAALVHDLPLALGRSPRHSLFAGRLASLGVALAAGLLAWGWGDLIALLGTFAFGTFAAALAPALVLGFSSLRVPPMAATASVATGLGLNLGLESWARWGQPPGWLLPQGSLPAAVALAGSITVLALATLLSRHGARRPPPDIAALLEG